MQYVGSKAKIVDEIPPIILANSDPHATYVEPFVGSASVVSKVPSTYTRLASDKNPYLIALLTAVRDGWVTPREVSEAEYLAIKASPKKYAAELVGFVSFACSFGGDMWGGYARGVKSSTNPAQKNFVDIGCNTLLKIAPLLSGVSFRVSSYISLDVPDNSIVYCDPPYERTRGYEYSINNFGEFWKWASSLVERNCSVFVSGYSKPLGWKVIWEKKVNTKLNLNKPSDRIEKLFVKVRA